MLSDPAFVHEACSSETASPGVYLLDFVKVLFHLCFGKQHQTVLKLYSRRQRFTFQIFVKRWNTGGNALRLNSEKHPRSGKGRISTKLDCIGNTWVKLAGSSLQGYRVNTTKSKLFLMCNKEALFHCREWNSAWNRELSLIRLPLSDLKGVGGYSAVSPGVWESNWLL